MPGSLDTFTNGDVRITVRNSQTGLLTSAEIKSAQGTIYIDRTQSNKWEIVASWLRGSPETNPAETKYNESQAQEVRDWAADQELAGGNLYRAGLKMLAEKHGWAVHSARRP